MITIGASAPGSVRSENVAFGPVVPDNLVRAAAVEEAVDDARVPAVAPQCADAVADAIKSLVVKQASEKCEEICEQFNEMKAELRKPARSPEPAFISPVPAFTWLSWVASFAAPALPTPSAAAPPPTRAAAICLA